MLASAESSNAKFGSVSEPGSSPSTPTRTPALRLATVADAEAIRTIYNHEVLHTVATFDLVARTLEDQQEWITQRSGAFAALGLRRRRPAGPRDRQADRGRVARCRQGVWIPCGVRAHLRAE